MTMSAAIPDVSISLISTNERHHLERLLPSLLPAARLANAEILVVDHRSVDGTRSYLEDHFPEVSVASNPVKSCYGENHNVNLRRARGRYFVVSNTDIAVNSPDLFVRLRDYLDQHPEVGIVSPKILNEDGTIQGLNKRHPTLLDLFLRRFLPKCLAPVFQRRMDYYEMRDVGYDHDYDVPFLSGAFLFCRTGLMQSIGGFDPGFYMYFDDVDLCRRVQKTHRTVYYPHVAITHFWRRIAHKNLYHTYLFSKMALRYFNQWGYKLF